MALHRIGKALTSLVVVAGASRSANAGLDLQLQQTPDFFAGFIDVNYNSSTDVFTASGFTFELDDDGVGPAESVQNGTFIINASINVSGVLTSGTLGIGGTIPALGFNSGTLLTGNLVNFGFPSQGAAPLEFALQVTGGDAASLFGTIPTGIILSGDTGFGGTFASSFNNLSGDIPGTGAAIMDAAPIVPLPSSLLLALGGLGAAVAGRRWGVL
jgi:hypothetical protein